MLDGRIDAQGTVEDLRAQGVLGSIAQEEGLALEQEKPVDAEEVLDPKTALDADGTAVEAARTPRKLVEDEHRAEGGVKWGIYNTYLEAS